MADAFNKKEEEEQGKPEIKPKEKPFFAPEAAEGKAEKEVSREAEPAKEEAAKEAVREEMEKIGKMTLSPNLKKQAGEEAVEINKLDKEGKISRLLALAKEKGLSYAINVAEQTNDPYLLDALHDVLIQKGLYKESEK